MIIELEKTTLAVLIAGLYSSHNDINPIAVPESVWIEIAEKLEYFLPLWDYAKITFEEWVEHGLLIYPKEFFSETEIIELQKDTLYWERLVGNVVLIISMDIRDINGE